MAEREANSNRTGAKLRELVAEIRCYFSEHLDAGTKIDRKTLNKFVERINDLEYVTRKTKSEGSSKCEKEDVSKYKYDTGKYPKLAVEHARADSKPSEPRTYAEALLWKQGDWKKYLDFYDWCTTDLGAADDHIVNYAFAQHLKSATLPIFDQHALRALWAVSSYLWKEKSDECWKYLFKISGGECTWESSGKGSTAEDCYKAYKRTVRHLIYTTAGNLLALDQLLMPLGKALKEHSAEGDLCAYTRFCQIVTLDAEATEPVSRGKNKNCVCCSV